MSSRSRMLHLTVIAAFAAGPSGALAQVSSEGSGTPSQAPVPSNPTPPAFKPSKGLSGGLGGVRSVGPKKTKLGGVKSKAGPRIYLPSPSARLPKPRPVPNQASPVVGRGTGAAGSPVVHLPTVNVVRRSGERRRGADFLFRPFGALSPVAGYYTDSFRVSSSGLEARGTFESGSLRGVFSLNSPDIVEWDRPGPCGGSWGYPSSVYDANIGIRYDEDCDGCPDNAVVGDPRYFSDGESGDPFLLHEADRAREAEAQRERAEAALSALDRGRLAWMRGDPSGAASALEEHLKGDPSDFDAMRLLGVSMLEARKPREAAAVIALAYERDPGLAARPFGSDLSVSGERLRELVRRATVFANASKSGSGWLVVASLMQGEGRSADALRMISKGRSCGLSDRVAQEMEVALSPQAKSAPAPRAPESSSSAGGAPADPKSGR